MPAAEDFRTLKGRRVRLELTSAGGGGSVSGTVAGTLEAADGLVVIVETDGGGRSSINYQHVAEIAEL